MKNPVMTIRTTRNQIVIELFPESAPNAVASVIRIAQQGLYNHREIRRIAPGFIIQPSFTFFDDPRLDIAVPGEFSANGFPNGAPMKKGSVAMAGDGKTIASGSEFFFCLTDEAGAQLQGKFPVIGRVLEGWDEIKRLEQVKATRFPVPDRDDVIVYIPDEPEYMTEVTVETYGAVYPEPEIIGRTS